MLASKVWARKQVRNGIRVGMPGSLQDRSLRTSTQALIQAQHYSICISNDDPEGACWLGGPSIAPLPLKPDGGPAHPVHLPRIHHGC